MIKRIAVDQLRVGMYVHDFCGSWMDHPFWRAKFLLRSKEEMQRITASGAAELWIDTSKGIDVRQKTAEAVVANEVSPPPEPAKPGQPMTREAALEQAVALINRSLPKISSLFTEARLGNAVDTAGCEALVDEISDSVMRNPGALISVARLKRHDEYTYMHSVAVCALMVSLGHQLGLKADQIRQAGLAGMLHDLGKALMPLELLNKPGKLTDAEYQVMKSHPRRGHELLVEGGGAGPEILDVCLHHHEKVDGTGYPDGLVGEKLSIFAKMGAICDVYDAVTSVRPYKKEWDPGEALRLMTQWKGHFEPRVFQAFVKTVGIFPMGALVRLQSGRLAVVMAQNTKSLLAPRVKVFFSIKSNLHIEPQEVDLSSRQCQDKIVACESPVDWSFKDLNQLWAPVR